MSSKRFDGTWYHATLSPKARERLARDEAIRELARERKRQRAQEVFERIHFAEALAQSETRRLRSNWPRPLTGRTHGRISKSSWYPTQPRGK